MPEEALLHPVFRRNLKIVMEYGLKIKVARENHDAKQADMLFEEMTEHMQH